MNSCRNLYLAVLVVITIGLLLCMSAVAQGPADLTAATAAATATDATASPDASPLPDAPPPAPQYPMGGGSGDSWRVAISVYGWFPGIHGTVGVLGHNAGIHVPFSDIWSSLKGLIPIAVEADKGRWVAPVDFFWVKLGAGKSTPFTDLTQRYVNIHLTQSILTPKIGYRLYDGEHLKIDALGGIRYWYIGQNLTLVPTGLSDSRSANWLSAE